MLRQYVITYYVIRYEIRKPLAKRIFLGITRNGNSTIAQAKRMALFLEYGSFGIFTYNQ